MSAPMMFIESPLLAAQAAAEGTGGATTGAALGGASPELLSPLPMGGEEVSAMLVAAMEAHAMQFLPVGVAGVAQREAFAATVGASGAAFTAMNAAGTALLGL